MGSRPTSNHTKDQFNMDTFFDFNQGTTEPSPAAGSSSKHWDAASPFDKSQDRQQFSGPSHDYNQYKQQVGLPMGSVSIVPQQSMFDGYNSGLDMGFDSWATGIDIDTDIPMDFNNMDASVPAMFFPTNNAPADNFVNPNSIGGEEPVSNVGRLWPGMHSQQAAMQKAAQTQAVQQRQTKAQFPHQQQQPQQQFRQPAPPAPNNGKRPAQLADPQVEERITRLLAQMRQNSAISNDDSASPSDLLPHVARMKKDEDDMDEDERLLASDEGKKLSSKERRQLRNKVSARAFRSRRKEYIGQLEGEVAVKAQEAATLRSENDALIQENERYRSFIETILRHPAFGPFMNDLSKDPNVLSLPQQQPQQQPQHQPTPQPPQQQQQQQQQQMPEDTKPAFLNFDASQIQVPQQHQTERVNLATIPEGDFSKLNINGFQNFNDFRSVNAFAVTDLPNGPQVDSLFSANPATFSSLAPATTVYTRDNSMDMLLAKLDRAASRV
ncbi:hypothetical protein AMS68_001715 [Peltaster fructicola]|uniref:BZIP domain-containing protein n=1 Tax=Peltaster fructicola TaxID=286661 RepID=A0A6H0XNK3_9PEZI|nr:hypothetical protein AMS68_001715 [Peltaster fructicola]